MWKLLVLSFLSVHTSSGFDFGWGEEDDVTILKRKVTELESQVSMQTTELSEQAEAIANLKNLMSEHQRLEMDELGDGFLQPTGWVSSRGELYGSCLEILLSREGPVPSGEYILKMPSGVLVKVYCDMGLEGGGFTYFSREGLSLVTNEDIRSISSRADALLVRLSPGRKQPYLIVKQLQENQASHHIEVSLNTSGIYQQPQSNPGAFMLYFGILPKETSAPSGVNINGKDVVGLCSSNGYLAQFPNYKEDNSMEELVKLWKMRRGKLHQSLGVEPVNEIDETPWWKGWMGQEPPSGRILPGNYFMQMEADVGVRCDNKGFRQVLAAVGFR